MFPASGASAATVAAKTQVIVTLAVPTAPAGADQSATIAQTADALLATLPAGSYTVVNRPGVLPFVTLTVSRAAAAVLKTSSLVTAYEVDKTVSASHTKRKCKVVKLKDGKTKVKMCKKVTAPENVH
ncbi:MAG: hypothetical protein WAP37_00740 [Solirubrobacterales bacterium]